MYIHACIVWFKHGMHTAVVYVFIIFFQTLRQTEALSRSTYIPPVPIWPRLLLYTLYWKKETLIYKNSTLCKQLFLMEYLPIRASDDRPESDIAFVSQFPIRSVIAFLLRSLLSALFRFKNGIRRVNSVGGPDSGSSLLPFVSNLRRIATKNRLPTSQLRTSIVRIE
jgi:hypothetical protein